MIEKSEEDNIILYSHSAGVRHELTQRELSCDPKIDKYQKTEVEIFPMSDNIAMKYKKHA